MSRRKLLCLALFTLLLTSPAPLRVWAWTGTGLAPAPFSRVEPLSPVASADFDGDGRPETLRLDQGRAVLLSGEQVRWESPPGWQVRQAEIADLNRDGLPEAVLLVWRPFKPWPVDQWLPSGGRIAGFHDSAGNSCHLILIGWQRSAFRERWAGSALAEPVQRFAVADLAGNGKPVLVALEAAYDESPSAPARRLKLWEWNGFGFSLIATLDGPFGQLALVRDANGRNLILLP
jgi:hypothetical protein